MRAYLKQRWHLFQTATDLGGQWDTFYAGCVDADGDTLYVFYFSREDGMAFISLLAEQGICPKYHIKP